jgi:hypothetical protein
LWEWRGWSWRFGSWQHYRRRDGGCRVDGGGGGGGGDLGDWLMGWEGKVLLGVTW